MDYQEKYVLITTAKNEQKHIEKTLLSVVNQKQKPEMWVIVNDGSTDNTSKIVEAFKGKYEFIELVEYEGNERRNFGGQLRAFKHGMEKLRVENYHYIGNLDADVSFNENYYKILITRMSENNQLGLTSGYIYEMSGKEFIRRKYSSENSIPGAVRLFKKKCFEDVGGYLELPYGGADWVAEVTARMKGWQVKCYPDLKVFHHRRTASAEGMIYGGYIRGKMDYSVGSHPIFEMMKCVNRINSKPFFWGAAARLFGYFLSAIYREERIVSKEIIRYLQNEQVSRIKKLMGKRVEKRI